MNACRKFDVRRRDLYSGFDSRFPNMPPSPERFSPVPEIPFPEMGLRNAEAIIAAVDALADAWQSPDRRALDREELQRRHEALGNALEYAFLHRWFTAETRAALRPAVERLIDVSEDEWHVEHLERIRDSLPNVA